MRPERRCIDARDARVRRCICRGPVPEVSLEADGAIPDEAPAGAPPGPPLMPEADDEPPIAPDGALMPEDEDEPGAPVREVPMLEPPAPEPPIAPPPMLPPPVEGAPIEGAEPEGLIWVWADTGVITARAAAIAAPFNRCFIPIILSAIPIRRSAAGPIAQSGPAVD